MVAFIFLSSAKVHFLFEMTKKIAKKIADILKNTCYFVVFYIFKTFF